MLSVLARMRGPRSDEPQPTEQDRNLQTLLVVAATNNTAWNLVTPFIPLFVLELVGGDPIAAAAWSGIALGISPLMTAVAGPFWGSFARALRRPPGDAPDAAHVAVPGRAGRVQHRRSGR